MSGYVIILAVSLGTTFVTTPLVRLLAIRLRAVDAPDERRIHTRPTPTLGGAAMYLGFVAAMFAASRIDQFDELFESTTEPLGVLLGATVIFLVGLVDDLREVSAPAKMAGQVFAGSVLSLFGVTMLYFRVPFGDVFALAPDQAPLITVLWVIGMANAVNFIDGLDGLAAGVVGIAAAAFLLYSDRLFDEGLLPTNIGPLIAVIVVGMCAGFLPFNFHPARIFMGDAGALLLGLLMACSTLLVGGTAAEGTLSGQTYFFFAPLVIPFVILGVPIFDTAFAMVRRASSRTSMAAADKGHLHHRLMRLGHGQRRSVLILWTWTALLSGFVLYPVYTGRGDAIVPFGLAALAVALFTVLHPQARRARSAQAADAPTADTAPPSE